MGNHHSGAIWRTSSRSNSGGNCVEVATNLPGRVLVRDSKQPDGGVLAIPREAWGSLLDDVASPDRHRVPPG